MIIHFEFSNGLNYVWNFKATEECLFYKIKCKKSIRFAYKMVEFDICLNEFHF